MIKTNISKDWYFEEDFKLNILRLGGNIKKKVDLPHDYVISHPRSKDAPGRWGNGFYPGGPGKYYKYMMFENKEHTILDIDGAYMCAKVLLNKDLLAIHPYGYTPMLIDLTDRIARSRHNKIEIFTNDMQPSSRWYAGAGLYRDVAIWTGGSVRIEPWDLYVVTNSANEAQADITVKTQISSDLDTDAVLHITLTDKGGNIAASVSKDIKVTKSAKTDADIDIILQTPLLWDTDNPHLYTLNAHITVDGDITDRYEQKCGIREIRFSAENGMTLNGKPIKLRGGCIHHDHGALGVASYPAAEERKVRKLKEAGFNALRTAHNPQSTAFMEACDRLGMIVMDEAFDIWVSEKRPNDYHNWFMDWWSRDISYMVMRDRSHPCIASYSIGNEIPECNGRSEGNIWAQKLSDEIRKYDKSRPVTIALHGNTDSWDIDGTNAPDDYKEMFYQGHTQLGNEPTDINSEWDEWTKEVVKPLDIVGYNYCYGRYAHDREKYPDRIIWGSETHAINIYHSWKAVMENNNVLGDFTWTAYDNMGETGAGRGEWGQEGVLSPLVLEQYPWRTCYQGDIDLAGYRRPQSYFREAVWFDNTEPRIFTTHPMHNNDTYAGTGWHWYDVDDTWTFDDKYIGESVKTEVYTQADMIRFVLNGKEVATAVPKECVATAYIPYEKGTLTAEAVRDNEVINTFTLTTATEPNKIVVVPEKDTILADRRDLCYFDISICDVSGNRITTAADKLQCTVDGGELLCIFSGDPCNDDQYTSDTCHAFKGRAVAVVKSVTKGKINIKITCDGLADGTASIMAV